LSWSDQNPEEKAMNALQQSIQAIAREVTAIQTWQGGMGETNPLARVQVNLRILEQYWTTAQKDWVEICDNFPKDAVQCDNAGKIIEWEAEEVPEGRKDLQGPEVGAGHGEWSYQGPLPLAASPGKDCTAIIMDNIMDPIIWQRDRLIAAKTRLAHLKEAVSEVQVSMCLIWVTGLEQEYILIK